MKKVILFLTIMLSLLATHSQAQTRQADSLALVMLYNSTNGANWTNTWDLSKPLDSLYGVFLNNNGRVTSLNLYNNNLAGGLPDLNLDRLQYLYLYQNQLAGAIPNFTNLDSLQRLWLQQNQLSRVIPNFSNIPALQTLILRGNQLAGTIPDFSNLPALEFLDLSGNQLAGVIPDFSNLTALERLYLSGNQLAGVIPDFSNLTALEHLALGHNQLVGTIPNFSNLTALQYLYLGGNQLAGTIPDFSNLPALQNLYLGENQLAGIIPNFSNLAALQLLYLDGNQLAGVIPDFSNLPVLQQLYLNENQFTFEDILPSYNSISQKITIYFFFRYTDQDSIGTIQTTAVATGSNHTIDLIIDDTVTTNTYYWYKDGTLIGSTLGINEYTISNFQATDVGTYTARIVNSIVTKTNNYQNLVLNSRPIRLTLGTGTGISDLAEVNPLVVSPNPVSDMLFITTSELEGAFQLEVINLQGQVVQSLQGEGNTSFLLPMADKVAGLYIIRMTQGDKVWQQKVVKK